MCVVCVCVWAYVCISVCKFVFKGLENILEKTDAT